MKGWTDFFVAQFVDSYSFFLLEFNLFKPALLSFLIPLEEILEVKRHPVKSKYKLHKEKNRTRVIFVFFGRKESAG